MIQRAIFVLTSPEAGQQFLRVVPDLREIGLCEATVLHIMSAQPGPAEPMADLANWVRHFEAALPKVELALKRGDPVVWVYELARVRRADLVVISGVPNGTDWDFERVSSPLRRLGVPILFLPDEELGGSLQERILVAVKAPETFERTIPRLKEWLGSDELQAVRVARSKQDDGRKECSGVTLETIAPSGDIAATLLRRAEECRATLVTILADEEAQGGDAQSAIPVVRPLLETTDRPVLIWPAS